MQRSRELSPSKGSGGEADRRPGPPRGPAAPQVPEPLAPSPWGGLTMHPRLTEAVLLDESLFICSRDR